MSTVANPQELKADHRDEPGGPPDPLARKPWVEGEQTLAAVAETISSITENPVPGWWWPAFLFSAALTLGGVFAAAYLISTGVGVWGEQIPVGWAFDITNFVFWIGIGHAGTLISAILFLFRQKWRTSINRFSEAMTLFAVICAGVYPTIHVGRVWYLWFFAPLPNPNHIWPQFKSPLAWDAFAVSTYFTVSLLFWYVGLIPDLATLRDRAKTRLRQRVFGLMAFGWRGSNRHWRHYEMAYLILAGISTPLVLSVHSIVSFDFATSVLPGWHTTIFPPYFVAGAIFGGFAMVLQCMIPARAMFGLQHFITIRHIETMAKIVLATGTLVGYAYIMEFFTAWYSGNPAEQETFHRRAFGEYWWAYWTMMFCNLIAPQIFWSKWARTTPWVVFCVSVLVNVGMWFERFVIIVTSLYQNAWNLASGNGQFYPTWVDWLQMLGDFGLFFTMTLLFIRFLPMIAMSEIKPLTAEAKVADRHHRYHLPGHAPHADDAHPAPAEPAAPAGKEGLYAVIAAFKGPNELLDAVKALRKAGYRDLDTATAYPVHGMNRAMGLKRSRLPWISLLGTVTGFSTGFLLQAGLQWFDYPIIVGGKDYTGVALTPEGGLTLGAAWQSMVPVLFELSILFTAFFTVGGMLYLCGLPRYYHPVFRSDAFAAATTDRHYLIVEASDPLFDRAATAAALERLGGASVELVEA